MTGRWNEVEPILDAALARPPHERAAFIAQACAGDDELRREVESLLAQEPAADGLLSTPGYVLLEADSFDHQAIIGRAIGPYTIDLLLGAGGMGEVYRAHDLQLDRDVAIKILPSAFTNHSDRLARFAREAKTLAALNHPRIAAIYGLEYLEGVPALVLELVEGPTIAERLADGPVPLTEAVGIALQIAEALEAAHGRGIIHRDLKPANIKVTPAGSVKLLDFGLAKGLQHQDAEVSGAGPSPLTTSSPGALLGTAAYMSPEQANGQAVDSRSDLFSLGAVLYEMLTGRPAFTGETLQQVLTAIRTLQPLPPGTIDRAVPSAVDRLVMRLLAKDRAARYQTAHDVRVELQRLARDLETGSQGSRRRWLERSAAAAILVALGVLGWISWRHSSGAAPVGKEYTQITHFADSATWPAVSSDGRLLTFIRGASTFVGRGQIYIKALPDGEPVRLTSDDLLKMSPVFSPDGSRIAYTASTSNFVWDTWIVGVKDRPPALWLSNASGLSWLGDRRLVFSEITRGLHMKVVTANEGRDDVRPVYTPSSEQGMAHRSSVSPDGAWQLIAEMEAAVWQPCRLVPADGSSSGRRVGPGGQCTSAAWSPDGKWMYFSSNSSGSFHIWRQRFPEGAPEQITDGPTEEEGIAPDPDGRSLLTSVGSVHSSIWIHDDRGEREISREGFAFIPRTPNGGTSQPLSADGHLAYYLVRQGAVRFKGVRERVGELWAANLATGASRPIVTGRNVIGYDSSHDGTQVAFAALDDRAVSHVWVMRLDRPEEPRQISTLEMDSPRFTRAGDVFCRGRENGQTFVYRLRPGGAPEKLLNQTAVFFLTVSPDGDWIIAKVQEDPGRSGSLINKAFPASGAGRPVRLCHGCEIDWTPDGRSLVVRFSAGGAAETLIMPLGPGGSMPAFPAEGFQSKADLAGLSVEQAMNGWVYPSGTGSTHVFARVSIQRNIYRIALR